MGLEQQVWSLSDGKRLREVKAPSEKQIEDLLAANIEILDAGWLVIGRQVKTAASLTSSASTSRGPWWSSSSNAS